MARGFLAAAYHGFRGLLTNYMIDWFHLASDDLLRDDVPRPDDVRPDEFRTALRDRFVGWVRTMV